MKGIKRLLKTKKFKYLNLRVWFDKAKNLKNHDSYDPIKKLIIDVTITALLVDFILFCFVIGKVLYGFGIAVTLAMTQYYVKWFYDTKYNRTR